MTGAAGSLGSAVVQRLVKEGARIVATDLHASDLVVLGQPSECVMRAPADLSECGAVERLVASAEAQGAKLDGFVHCAAIGSRVPLLECSLDRWNRIQAVNLTSTFDLCQSVGRRIAAQGGGGLLAFSSGAGVRPNAGNIPYGASKAGVVGLMRAAALDMARFGVRANVLTPGPIDTPLMRTIAGDAADQLQDRTMLGRFGAPAEVASAVAFLLSDQAQYITGAVLNVDGGFTASGVRFTS